MFKNACREKLENYEHTIATAISQLIYRAINNF